jgi:uncharacterized glyoxalase superfamily metalloenzyme YdcJ
MVWLLTPALSSLGEEREKNRSAIQVRFIWTGKFMSTSFADKVQMQNRLFTELSRMFGQEVPLYDKSLLVNRETNKTVCALLSQLHVGFALSDEQLDKTSGERHGAIRIGKPSEYRLMGRFFAAFGMEPHNFYDMANVGAKSQPIIATAFRSKLNPDHRIFCSLLLTDYFDAPTKARIEALLATREVFSAKAKQLLDKNEQQGGLSWDDATALIAEGVNRIFKWTGQARDHQLYKDLCDAGFKIAADIACFESHHLNHLTPNTFCMDLYTAAMKFCMGEMDAATFGGRATTALGRLVKRADRDWMRLHFKQLDRSVLESYQAGAVSADSVAEATETLIRRLQHDDLALSKLKHAGFKDFTEGPAEDTPVLLRQDAYKALTEPVKFRNADGSTVDTVHTARFGEIEQRFYATTTKGRELYDHCLAEADAAREKNPGLAKKDFAAYEEIYAKPFAPFPKTLLELLAQKLVCGRYVATPKGVAARGSISTTDINELVSLGYVDYEGLRYEDFLPVSAAGIFASNLSQYGTKSTAVQKPVYTQAILEEILGRKIVDSNVTYAGLEAESLWRVYSELGLLDKIKTGERSGLEQAIASAKAN